jgi:hypothetical protein
MPLGKFKCYWLHNATVLWRLLQHCCRFDTVYVGVLLLLLRLLLQV